MLNSTRQAPPEHGTAGDHGGSKSLLSPPCSSVSRWPTIPSAWPVIVLADLSLHFAFCGRSATVNYNPKFQWRLAFGQAIMSQTNPTVPPRPYASPFSIKSEGSSTHRIYRLSKKIGGETILAPPPPLYSRPHLSRVQGLSRYSASAHRLKPDLTI